MALNEDHELDSVYVLSIERRCHSCNSAWCLILLHFVTLCKYFFHCIATIKVVNQI